MQTCFILKEIAYLAKNRLVAKRELLHTEAICEKTST
jgi:hypothetical protein